MYTDWSNLRPYLLHMSYTQVSFSHISSEKKELLIALLSEAGFDGFEETDDTLHAFAPSSSFDDMSLKNISEKINVEYTTASLPDTNWNQVWESNFEPVLVGDFCAVRAGFHNPVVNVAHEIIINPKMSFGTGHHATTYMMIEQMKSISMARKKVLDFGTGTGVLALLAVKCGATDVTAIDNDEWSIANAGENFDINGIEGIHLLLADSLHTGGQFDVILANITRNVILDNFSSFVDHLATGGILLLSGLLEDDETYVVEAASRNKLELLNRMQREKWICVKFKK